MGASGQLYTFPFADATFGGGPSNSNISHHQVSGRYLSGIFVSQFASGQHVSGIAYSGGTGLVNFQSLSGVYTANVPRGESSWNV